MFKNDFKIHARVPPEMGSFSNKIVEKTAATNDKVFNSSKNQFFEISNGVAEGTIVDIIL